MRGIALEQVDRVVLVTAQHPKVQTFQRDGWVLPCLLYGWNTAVCLIWKEIPTHD
jgi:hypothetical protein